VQTGKLWIGTSGWHYGHWVGRFYPADARSRDFLGLYARVFRTVEINNTFYALPEPESVRAWRESTPPGFLFAVKGSRYITHRKKLNDPSPATKRFFDAIGGLGPKLGPILFQLPPRWHVDVERLAAFLEALPGEHRYAFEFRDPSWFDSAVYELLRRRRVACCAWELAGRRSPVIDIDTAPLVYVRLHGPGAAYQGSYDGRTLRGWARRIARWRDAGKDVHVYFDNDQNAYAAIDAARLQAMCGEARPAARSSYDAAADTTRRGTARRKAGTTR
jgi:uncharacterized protein YecE (DUF72 family)